MPFGDPLNAFAVSGPVMSAHDSVAAQMEEGHGGLYAVWGEPVLPKWVDGSLANAAAGHSVADDSRRAATSGNRRQMVLGPGKEFALIVPPGISVAAPAGWSALAIERERVDAPV
jgi:hypothetical protein